jgi:hypothetical protein
VTAIAGAAAAVPQLFETPGSKEALVVGGLAVQGATAGAGAAMTSAGLMIAVPLLGAVGCKTLQNAWAALANRSTDTGILATTSKIGKTRVTTIKMQEAAPVEAAPVETKAQAAPAKFCYGLPGSTPPFVDFDPWSLLEGKKWILANKKETLRWRESEIVHGRTCMLASLAFFVQEDYHPLLPNATGTAMQQWEATPWQIKLLILFGMSWYEGFRTSERPFLLPGSRDEWDMDYFPGDTNWDPLGLMPQDPKGRKEMRERELNNGRLAMLAVAGLYAQESVTGTPWAQLLPWYSS